MNRSTIAIMAIMAPILLRWKKSGMNGNATAETKVPTRM